MTPTCSLLVPTRGRPGVAAGLVDNFLAHAAHPERVEIIFRVHHDDPASTCLFTNSRVRLLSGDTEDGYGSLDHFVNSMAAVSNGDWLWSLCDDARVLTRGWDEIFAQTSKDPRFEPLALVPKTVNLPERRVLVLSRGFYRALGHLGMTTHADCYIDSLAHFADIMRPIDVELSDGGLPDVAPRDRVKTWAQYRGPEVSHCFNLDKLKLGAVLGKPITEKWSTCDAPEQP